MNSAGTALLALVAAFSLAAVVLPLVGRRLTRPLLVRAGTGALYAVLALVVAAAALLLAALLARDFGNLYVYEHSSRALSVVYTVSALWAGNAGSLLLWLLLTAIFAVAAARGSQKRDPGSAPYLMALMAFITLFFSLLMLLGPRCDPFAANPVTALPEDGLGLNPMLENPGMIVHPLTLYLGYVALSVPFALVIAGLVSGSPLAVWIVSVRRWALAGWLFLTLGNVIGGWWAYVTLGWGGYWAWDPVENASLIPWLTATALLHSAFVAQRRRRQQVWTVVLAAATFLLTIFGTFLTRTGVAASVHAFTEPSLIAWFVVFMLVLLALALGVVIWRRTALRAEGAPAAASEENANVLYTVVVLSALAVFILWGVIFPPIAKSLASGEFVLGTAYFDTVAAPLGVALLLLLVFCSVAGFSRGARRGWAAGLSAAAGVGLAVLVVLLVTGVRKGYPVAAFVVAGAALVAVVLRAFRNRRARRSYGALLAHLGLLILVVGLAGSWSFKQSTEGQLAPGQTLALGRYAVTYEGLQREGGGGGQKEVTRAVVALTADGADAGRLEPTIEYYPLNDQVWTRVARRTSAAGDVYVLLQSVSADGQTIDLRLEYHPLIVWLWVGGGVMSAGALVAMWALLRRRQERSRDDAGDPGVPVRPRTGGSSFPDG